MTARDGAPPLARPPARGSRSRRQLAGAPSASEASSLSPPRRLARRRTRRCARADCRSSASPWRSTSTSPINAARSSPAQVGQIASRGRRSGGSRLVGRAEKPRLRLHAELLGPGENGGSGGSSRPRALGESEVREREWRASAGAACFLPLAWRSPLPRRPKACFQAWRGSSSGPRPASPRRAASVIVRNLVPPQWGSPVQHRDGPSRCCGSSSSCPITSGRNAQGRGCPDPPLSSAAPPDAGGVSRPCGQTARHHDARCVRRRRCGRVPRRSDPTAAAAHATAMRGSEGAGAAAGGPKVICRPAGQAP